MTKLPFLPLFVDDFFGGTMRWSGEQQGLYALLLMHQWASGPLPAAPSEIAQAIKYEPKRFAALWKTVQNKFTLTEEGWANQVLEDHRATALHLSERRAENGSKGGKASAKARAEAKVLAQLQAKLPAEPVAGLQAELEQGQSNTGSKIQASTPHHTLRGLPGGKGV
jgi:uncharacterized protein YdaU (DUF1376 family)